MIPEHQWTVAAEATSSTSNEEVSNPEVSKSATGVEVLDWKLTNSEEPKNYSHLRSACVISEVEVRFVNWSGYFEHFASWEPALDL